MFQLISLAVFSAVIAGSIAVIVRTFRAELPYVVRALALDATPLPPPQSTRAPRVRITRPLRAAVRHPVRAAA